jgi:hypothetical protein
MNRIRKQQLTRLKKIKRSLTGACVAYRGLKEVYTPLITASESISEAIRAAEENIAKIKPATGSIESIFQCESED